MKTNWRAKELYSWRGMSSEINLLIYECEICCPFLLFQGKEPIISGTMSTGPMTDVGSDLFQIGHNYYIVMIDRYSNFPFVEKLTKLSTAAIIKVLTNWFNTNCSQFFLYLPIISQTLISLSLLRNAVMTRKISNLLLVLKHQTKTFKVLD